MFHTINRLKIAVLILSVVTFASGQPLSGYGVKLGLNLANVSGSDVDDFDPAPSMKLGAAVGGFATFDFDLPVTLQLEGLYSTKGYVIEEGSSKFTVAVNYIDINILAKYEAAENIQVFAGPSLGLAPGGRVEWEFDDESGTEDFKSEDFNGMDFGLIIGGSYGLTLPFGDIEVEARYSLGLKNAYMGEEYDEATDTYKDKVAEIKNNVIQILVSYAL